MCYKSNVPLSHQYTPVISHLILYITYTYEPESTYLYWSVVCARDKISNRPLAIQLNVNFSQLKTNKFSHQFNIQALMHELFHSLAFSLENIKYFDQNPLVLQNKQDQSNLNQPLFIQFQQKTHKNTIKQHFNCDTDSLPLQMLLNDQDIFTLQNNNTHWDRMVLMNSIMTANLLPNAKITNFDLIMLESSTWYKIKKSFIQQNENNYTWGENKGCQFINNFTDYYVQNNFKSRLDKINQQQQWEVKKILNEKGIKENQKINKINNYGIEGICSKIGFDNFGGACSYDYKYYATCNLDSYSDPYSYFIPSYNGSCTDQHRNSHNTVQLANGEQYNSKSRCFISTFNIKPIQVEKNNHLIIKNKNQQYLKHLNHEKINQSSQYKNNININQSQSTNQNQNQTNNNGLLNAVRCYESFCNSDYTSIDIKIYLNTNNQNIQDGKLSDQLNQTNNFNQNQNIQSESIQQHITVVCKKDYEIIENQQLFNGYLKCPKIVDFCHNSNQNQ